MKQFYIVVSKDDLSSIDFGCTCEKNKKNVRWNRDYTECLVSIMCCNGKFPKFVINKRIYDMSTVKKLLYTDEWKQSNNVNS